MRWSPIGYRIQRKGKVSHFFLFEQLFHSQHCLGIDNDWKLFGFRNILFAHWNSLRTRRMAISVLRFRHSISGIFHHLLPGGTKPPIGEWHGESERTEIHSKKCSNKRINRHRKTIINSVDKNLALHSTVGDNNSKVFQHLDF